MHNTRMYGELERANRGRDAALLRGGQCPLKAQDVVALRQNIYMEDAHTQGAG